MRMSQAVDVYIADQFATGRFNSEVTERGYRYTLHRLADHVANRDPRTVGRDDIKSFLARWPHPNTRGMHHSHVSSFFDYAMEEGWRKDNPARQVRRSKTRRPTVYRLTRDEVRAFRDAARGDVETAVADLGLLAGLRSKEMLGLQGRHFRRPGWVWVSGDIAKGGRERWVRVLPELERTWERLSRLPGDHHVFPRQYEVLAGNVRRRRVNPYEPIAYETLHKLVGRVGRRAGIAAKVTPHVLRHAFGDHIARFAGIRVAQFVLGHQSVKTTEGYLGGVTLDEIARAMEGFGYGTGGLPAQDRPVSAVVEPQEGLYPVSRAGGGERDWAALGRLLSPVVAGLWFTPGVREAAKEMAEADA